MGPPSRIATQGSAVGGGSMAGRRVERLNEQLKRELSDLLHTQVRDPRIGPVTITGVETTPDLYSARIYVSSLGSPEEKKTSIEGLRAAAAFLRSELGKRLRIRRVPELSWQLDETLDHAMRIERLLSEVLPRERSDAEDEADGRDDG
jgi:ribosome-binding factor A